MPTNTVKRVPPSGSRILYPTLPASFTPADLNRLFGPSYHDRRWAPTVARTPASQVAMLVQLGVFRTLGRFLPIEEIPICVIDYLALKFDVETPFRLSASTVYRHQRAVLAYVGVTAWNDEARQLTEVTMMNMAEARTDPADLINAAIDVLVRHRYELPALRELRRLTGTAHHAINEGQWQQVYAQLKDGHCAELEALLEVAPDARESPFAELEALLEVAPDARESPFAELCSGVGRATRKNLKALTERYEWLCTLPDPTKPLASIADAKVLQWANEARRLKAPELREYVTPRRLTLLLAVIREARGRILDEMTQMLLKLTRQIEWHSEGHLADWHAGRHDQTDSLILALRDLLRVHGTVEKPAQKIPHLEAVLSAHGGREALETACVEHLRHERKNWRPFSRQAFMNLRAPLMRLANALPLTGSPDAMDLLSLIAMATWEDPPYSDYIPMESVKDALPQEWRALVLDDKDDPIAHNRRYVEVAAILELGNAIKAARFSSTVP